MKNNVIIGIDISAQTLDLCVKQNGRLTSMQIKNHPQKIKSALSAYTPSETIIAMENTGRYNNYLYEVLVGKGFRVYVINPIHLKRSIGFVRGKNDKIDAQRICLFIEKNADSVPCWSPCPQNIEKIKVLYNERAARIKMKNQLTLRKSSYKFIAGSGLKPFLEEQSRKMADLIKEQIKDIENQIAQIIKTDTELNDQIKLLLSVPGVGKIVAWAMLIKTQGFTLITEPRKLACYAGIVPFENQSGTSLKGKPRVSGYSDKSLKTLLHLAAMSSIRLKNDLRTYYERKVKSGKNKMSVLNAVRNKIVHRIFAVIKHRKTYINNLAMS